LFWLKRVFAQILLQYGYFLTKIFMILKNPDKEIGYFFKFFLFDSLEDYFMTLFVPFIYQSYLFVLNILKKITHFIYEAS